jgi:hypothetical protein
VALAHHIIVDQAALIKNCFTLLTVYLTEKLNVTFILPDKKLCVSVSLKLMIIYCSERYANETVDVVSWEEGDATESVSVNLQRHCVWGCRHSFMLFLAIKFKR